MDLPTDLLRSLVAIADTGSLARAGERVLRTPSALSLQMSKLEALVGLPLFEPRGRGRVLTPAGELLLAHAREILERNDAAVRALAGAARAGRVRFGLVQDFVAPFLGDLLSRLSTAHPLAQVEVRVAGSADLRRAVGEDELDVAVAARGEAPLPPLRSEAMVWVGDRRLAMLDEVPLVLVERPCPFADAAVSALQTAGRRCRVALRTPSLSSVRAAVRAGLGLGCRTRLFAGTELPVLGPADGLPELPSLEYALFRRRPLSTAGEAVCGLLEQMLGPTPSDRKPCVRSE